MMKRNNMYLVAGLALVGLAGCAGSPDTHELSQSTVEYRCGPGGEQPLTVQYTFRGDQAVSARVIHMNQVVDMMRVTESNADRVGNTFRGAGYTWVTEKFDREDVDEVNGNILTVDTPAGAAYGAPSAPYGSPQGAPGVRPGYPAGHPGAGGAYAGGAPAGQPGTVGTVLVRDCRPT